MFETILLFTDMLHSSESIQSVNLDIIYYVILEPWGEGRLKNKNALNMVLAFS